MTPEIKVKLDLEEVNRMTRELDSVLALFAHEKSKLFTKQEIRRYFKAQAPRTVVGDRK